MFWTQDGEWVSQLPEEIHEGKPHHTGEQKPLSMHYTDTKQTAFCEIICEITYITVLYFQYANQLYVHRRMLLTTK